jgi:hypothetical protein
MIHNDLARLVQEERHREIAEPRRPRPTALPATDDQVLRIAKPFKPRGDFSAQIRVRAEQLAD